MRTERIGAALLLLSSLLLLVGSACSKPSGGPIDGTWLVTNVTCGGAAYTGLSNLAAAAITFTFNNATGSLSEHSSSLTCTDMDAINLTYSGTTLNVTNAGNYTCTPAACDSNPCGGAGLPNFSTTYALTGINTMTWTVNNSTDCTGSSQGQPEVYTLSRQ